MPYDHAASLPSLAKRNLNLLLAA
ncbi:MAG: hypothetical protein QOH09_4871, partial [Pseudonocardiales bacterium]|nr:hypothetical protein [Pseudonocardiales bacterium]